ncbi:ABC transporter permease [Aquihabitans sp. G128]|uniref:ABC transporter permease n=1 Tax=Aquihabitans sp. G128 TaxID=2849779 RepID=UPI001C23B09A|nr:ABC transporter permease [Aquihabitans sp. G128]QXC62902.1 ABC transporter permease [Aquihabitans sp. G128]
MTSTTSTTALDPATTADTLPATKDAATGAGFTTAALATGRRTVLQFFRTPQLLMMGTIQGALFLFMFRYVFGGAISTRGDLNYVDWLVPGFLVTVILWTGMGAASGVAEDSSSGVYDRLRSLPIPRAAVMMGRSLADGALVGWGIFTTAIIGFIIGFRAHGGIGSILLAFLLMLVAGYAFSWIFITLGLISGNAQAAQGMSMLVIPFSFISNANVPVASMPGWMQPFAANQPVSVIINAVRSLMQGGTDVVGIGHSTAYWVALSLVWCAGIFLVFSTLATARFSKTQ